MVDEFRDFIVSFYTHAKQSTEGWVNIQVGVNVFMFFKYCFFYSNLLISLWSCSHCRTLGLMRLVGFKFGIFFSAAFSKESLYLFFVFWIRYVDKFFILNRI